MSSRSSSPAVEAVPLSLIASNVPVELDLVAIQNALWDHYEAIESVSFFRNELDERKCSIRIDFATEEAIRPILLAKFIQIGKGSYRVRPYSPPHCHYCGEDGHFVRDCPQSSGLATRENLNRAMNEHKRYFAQMTNDFRHRWTHQLEQLQSRQKNLDHADAELLSDTLTATVKQLTEYQNEQKKCSMALAQNLQKLRAIERKN